MGPIPWRSILGYGAIAAVVLVCLRITSLAPLWFDWGRELSAAAITLVAVGVGMRLTRTPTAAGPAEVVAGVVADAAPAAAAPEFEAGLTPRERQILALLERGLTNKELARELGVSPNTVKTHLANLYPKLDASRRTEALANARRRGILRT